MPPATRYNCRMTHMTCIDLPRGIHAGGSVIVTATSAEETNTLPARVQHVRAGGS